MATDIRTVGVIGTGVIGASWTALFLSRGLHVLVSDPAPGAEETLSTHLDSMWPTLEEVGLAQGASKHNYRFVGKSLEKYYGEVDFIQENAPEKLQLKIDLIAEIDAGARPEVIIASSSSGLPASSFITACKNQPERVLIGHPYNPPHLMPLVEIVPHPGNTSSAVDRAIAIYTSLGKTSVLIKKEVPGFAANRLQTALLSEAYSLVLNGVLSATDVDKCITTSLGPRWAFTGPFMSNVSGGGGGREGFKHFFSHLGPAMVGYLKDMRAHEFEFSEANMEALDKIVQEELDVFDPDVVAKQRDELTIKLLKDKKKASAIV